MNIERMIPKVWLEERPTSNGVVDIPIAGSGSDVRILMLRGATNCAPEVYKPFDPGGSNSENATAL